MVQLPDSLIEELDGRAARDGVSRSQVIRDAVATYLDDGAEERAALTVAAYGKHPFGEPDAWGDVSAWFEALRRARSELP
jgi:Arc/MetJ-type ribon-helix-helix transcriptional regulator